MAALAFLHQVKRASPAGFALFRIGFGLWLAWHFAALAPWAPEVFSAAGTVPDPALNPIHGLLPNPLAWFGAPWVSVAWCLVGAGLALLLAAGWRRVPVALALWFVWAALFNRNVLTSNPSIPYVGLLLLLLALVPDGEPWRWRGRAVAPRDWALPAGVFFTAWALMALGYTFSGVVKLQSPSWVDGTAFTHLLHNPLARPGWFRDVALGLPAWVQAGLTWAALAAEIAFLPLCFTRRGRAWAWSALLGMHLGILLVIDFADLTFGMLALHAFTFDSAWLPPRARPGRRPVLFYDGECGLCNAVVRFLLREDDAGVLVFAPLQSPLGQRTLQRLGLPTSDFDSILFLRDLDADRGWLRTRGVIGVLDALGGVWRVLAWALRLVPAPLRDLGYKLVARLRYALFGPYVASPLPEPRWAERILSDV
jgi:predicted DCC family thiol-disulfide oxidoreductase YuxK